MPNAVHPSHTTIGWIGTGVMGASMCGHLLQAGYPVTLYSRTRAKAQPLLDRGAAACRTLDNAEATVQRHAHDSAMKKNFTTYIRWLLPVFCLTLSACSTSKGFDRAGMRESLHQRLLIADEHEPTDSPKSTAPLSEPFRLGVYFVRTEFPTRESIHSGEWLSAEKDLLVHSLSRLRDGRIVREVVVLAEPTVRTLTRQELRQASVRYGIDVLWLVDGIGAVDRHNNAYSFLYPTIIGAWLAPGTVIDALFILNGRLWDLRIDKLLDRQTAEGQAQRTGAVVLVEDADVLKEAKHRAIEAFGGTFVDRLRSLQRERDPALPLP